MSDAIRRATSLRKRRLHACGCIRLHVSHQDAAEWLQFVTVVEEYADGELKAKQFLAAVKRVSRSRRPQEITNDIAIAVESDEMVGEIWANWALDQAILAPGDAYYSHFLARHRILEDLVGTGPLPVFSPSWRTDTIIALAHTMYDSRDFSAMPILADALQDAGCDNDAILNHCRDTSHPHVRGCWVVDLLMGRK